MQDLPVRIKLNQRQCVGCDLQSWAASIYDMAAISGSAVNLEVSPVLVQGVSNGFLYNCTHIRPEFLNHDLCFLPHGGIREHIQSLDALHFGIVIRPDRSLRAQYNWH